MVISSRHRLCPATHTSVRGLQFGDEDSGKLGFGGGGGDGSGDSGVGGGGGGEDSGKLGFGGGGCEGKIKGRV